jgi:hypothetical protein
MLSRPLAGIARAPSVRTQSTVLVDRRTHFFQAFRRYASAAPTAAFAGKKDSKVSAPESLSMFLN